MRQFAFRYCKYTVAQYKVRIRTRRGHLPPGTEFEFVCSTRVSSRLGTVGIRYRKMDLKFELSGVDIPLGDTFPVEKAQFQVCLNVR